MTIREEHPVTRSLSAATAVGVLACVAALSACGSPGATASPAAPAPAAPAAAAAPSGEAPPVCELVTAAEAEKLMGPVDAPSDASVSGEDRCQYLSDKG